MLGMITAAGILAVCLESPVSLLIFAVTCGLPLLAMSVGTRWIRRGAVVVAATIWSTALSQGLFYSDQPRVSVAQLGPLHLYREGLYHGLAQSMRFVGLSLAGIALAISTPPDRMFAALAKLRVPFGLALMAATALRFLPTLGREMLTVRKARRPRGRPAWQRTPTQWIRLEIALLRPVIARSWRRAQNLAETLDTRGFDPLAPRTERVPLRMRPLDWGLLLTAVTISVGVAGCRMVYILYTTETAYFPALRPLYGFVRSWL
jgi:energy-coupling factor transporter transmembrane protein EcfT